MVESPGKRLQKYPLIYDLEFGIQRADVNTTTTSGGNTRIQL